MRAPVRTDAPFRGEGSSRNILCLESNEAARLRVVAIALRSGGGRRARMGGDDRNAGVHARRTPENAAGNAHRVAAGDQSRLRLSYDRWRGKVKPLLYHRAILSPVEGEVRMAA